jgi:hypothetical protein
LTEGREVATIEEEIEAQKVDENQYDGQPREATDKANACMAAQTWWEKFIEFFRRLAKDIAAKLAEFATAVVDFFAEIKNLDVGNPTGLEQVANYWLECQSNLSGIDVYFEPRSLPALKTWEGGAGDVYTRGTPVQRSATKRAAEWSGSAGSILMTHSTNVVNAFLTMRLTMQKSVLDIGNKLSSLTVAIGGAVLDPTKILSVINEICSLAYMIAGAVFTMRTEMEKWANQTMQSVKNFQVALANKTGTEQGAWPSFV